MTFPTSCTRKLLLVSPVLITFCFLGKVLADNDNYPTQDHNPKPCARINNTIIYQKSLCVPNCNGRFTNDSEANCKVDFKEKCPEYNQGRCEWFNFTIDGSAREIPTCRLCYYAKSETWMEVFFTHQRGDWMSNKSWNKYGDACAVLPIMNVVEVHRHVKKTDAFGDRNQQDWPNNVLDSTGERGLTWYVVPRPSGLPLSILNSFNGMCSELTENPYCKDLGICGRYQQENTDNRKLCEVDFVDYLKRVYPKGFNDALLPEASDDEVKMNCTVSINLVGACIDVGTQEGIVTRGCQVLYTRSSVYNPQKGDKWKCEFVFLEFDGYNMARDEQDKIPVGLRYSYWSMEDKNKRNKIFCNSRVEL